MIVYSHLSLTLTFGSRHPVVPLTPQIKAGKHDEST